MTQFDILLLKDGKSLKEISVECYWNEVGFLALDSMKKYDADDYRIYHGSKEIK